METALPGISIICCYHRGRNKDGRREIVTRSQQRGLQVIGRSHTRQQHQVYYWEEDRTEDTETAPVKMFHNQSLILPESHVLPPQPASLVPPALRALLPVHENQLSALPLKPGLFSDPRNKERKTHRKPRDLVWSWLFSLSQKRSHPKVPSLCSQNSVHQYWSDPNKREALQANGLSKLQLLPVG